MVAKDIDNFAQIRVKARAYFCYLFSKNLPNRLPEISVESIMGKMQKIKGDLKECEGVYLLDYKGVQVSPTFLKQGRLDEDVGLIRSDRAYYYRAMKERRCTITDPYPSLITQELTITASQPVFDETGNIQYVACMDMPLNELLRVMHPMAFSSVFGQWMRYSYAAYALALSIIALMLFFKAIGTIVMFGQHLINIELNDIFESTILLTLSLAIFDLVKTLLEEEVLGERSASSTFDMHKTMVRFLGSIIIALSIEALMLVFKFAITEPSKLINAIYIIGGVFLLMIGLAVYIRFTNQKEES